MSHAPDPSGSDMYGELLRQQDYFHKKIAELEKTIQHERRISAVLLADKKRLDHLQSKHWLGAVIWKGQADLGWLVMGQTTTHATLREAIDADVALAERSDGLASSESCPACNGSGSIPNGIDEMACGRCTGTGLLKGKEQG